ncbi:unnamed protein product [Enterobius vermicularis]|uniref:Small subunit terminase n=1 Tax=Enterobius vermicularis TaxID=51028 RepID=A0A0N4USI2_ENTVE|nr:unnamed protein product [Enterobius vermicularis]
MEEKLPGYKARRTRAEVMTSLIRSFRQMIAIYDEGVAITPLAKGNARRALLYKEYQVRRVFLNYLDLHLKELRAALNNYPGGVSPKGEYKTLPKAQGTTNKDYQEDSGKKKKPALKSSAFTSAGKR